MSQRQEEIARVKAELAARREELQTAVEALADALDPAREDVLEEEEATPNDS